MPGGQHASTAPRTRAGGRRPGRGVLTTALTVLLAVVATGLLVALAHQPSTPPTPSPPGPVAGDAALAQPAPQRPSPADLPRLPVADTLADPISTAPLMRPEQHPTGLLLQPTVEVPLYAAPGGAAIARLQPTQRVDPLLPADHPAPNLTRVPVVSTGAPDEDHPDLLDTAVLWRAVELPSRPNASLAWVYTGDHTLMPTTATWRLHVDRPTHTLTASNLTTGTVQHFRVDLGQIRNGQSLTPAGPTFILALVAQGPAPDGRPPYSPAIYVLGTHSTTWDRYGGGRGTVGIHAWLPGPQPDGSDRSDGCVRLRLADLQQLITVDGIPAGTPVEIT